MDMPKYKVYIEVDDQDNIIKVGSDSPAEKHEPNEHSILLDEGNGDKYAHAQSNYFELPLLTMAGIAQYKYIVGKAVEKTPEEIQAEIDALPKPPPEPITLLSQAVTDLEIRDIEKDIVLTDLEIEIAELKSEMEGV